MSSPDHSLRRELKLRDLVFMQLLLVLALNSVGYAAKQGPSQMVLWLLAIALFYVPLSIVVMKLCRALPFEGGVYQWVKIGISPFAGFMAAWSMALYIICFFASYGSQFAGSFAYAAGPKYAWMGTSEWFPLLLMFLLCALAFVVNVRGLSITKWFSNVSSLLTIAFFLLLVFLLFRAPSVRTPAHHSSALSLPALSLPTLSLPALSIPALSILSVNVFTKMALFALSGLDQCAVFTEECCKPKNDVARSVLVAAPLIALIYILGTYAVLAYVTPGQVDLAAPVSQVISAGFGPTRLGHAFTAICATGFNVMLVGALVLVVGMVARLPMVAGWDGILPGWLSELDPRYRVPTKAIAAVSAALVLMAALSLLGAHNQEAVQVLSAVGYGCYCLMYLLLFGSVIFGFRSGTWRPGISLRALSLAALLVVLVSFGFELVPVGEVASPLRFAMKVICSITVVSATGAALYWRGTAMLKRRRVSENMLSF